MRLKFFLVTSLIVLSLLADSTYLLASDLITPTDIGSIQNETSPAQLSANCAEDCKSKDSRGQHPKSCECPRSNSCCGQLVFTPAFNYSPRTPYFAAKPIAHLFHFALSEPHLDGPFQPPRG